MLPTVRHLFLAVLLAVATMTNCGELAVEELKYQVDLVQAAHRVRVIFAHPNTLDKATGLADVCGIPRKNIVLLESALDTSLSVNSLITKYTSKPLGSRGPSLSKGGARPRPRKVGAQAHFKAPFRFKDCSRCNHLLVRNNRFGGNVVRCILQ